VNWGDIKSQVNMLADGRTFSSDKYVLWANAVRKRCAANPMVRGFRGLYFLYKEATVTGGSVADQARYAIPNDFIDDLHVFYDGALLAKHDPGVVTVIKQLEDLPSTPQMVTLMGVEFEISPAPDEGGKEIKLFYNGFPDNLSTTTGEDYMDYFMQTFPDVHTFGMAERAALHLGGKPGMEASLLYAKKYNDAVQEMVFQNRGWYAKNSKIRVLNWDAFKEIKYLVFPQFRENPS
jgi:hypothetical protein